MKGHIYQLLPESSNFIGKRSAGEVSNYYPGEPITDEEVAAVQAAAEKLGVDVLNTRFVSRLWSSRPPSDCIWDSVKKTSPTDFALLVASAETKVAATHEIDILDKKAKLTVEYGDFSGPLSKAVAALKEVRIVLNDDEHFS